MRWLALAGLYLALVGQASRAEIVAGLLAGLAAALFSLLLREATARPLRLHAPWHRLVARVLVAILRDTARVTAALLRTAPAGNAGRRATQPYAPGGAGPEEEAGHRALVILLASVAPNAYVIEALRSSLIVHRLANAAPAKDRRWPI
jgi:hypothetical protein